ncbi:MAG: helix-turn-helix domain-containing protein [Kineosporiaceae bacterium]
MTTTDDGSRADSLPPASLARGGEPGAGSPARARLLAAASALFYAEGIHRVGVDRIIEAAQVTRATFYRHFPGKEDLVLAYVRTQDRLVRDAVTALASRRQGSELLLDLAASVGEQLCAGGFRGCPFINAAAEYPDPADPVHRAVVEHRAWFEGVCATALAEAGHPDPVGAARTFLMLRDGAETAGYLGDAAAARQALVGATLGLLAAAPQQAGPS